MILFKCGRVILFLSYILSLCYHLTYQTKTLDIGLVVLYVASAAIAGKIIYDRFQQINILSSLTSNPNVTSFANKSASFSATSMFLGFLVNLFVFLFKVDSYCVTALNIFVCAFCTLYMWMQGIVTVYVSSLYYDRNITALRQCLASFSTIVLVIMAIMGTIATFLPQSTSPVSAAYICLYITSLCSYVLAAIFCLYVLSFEKDYKYFAEDLRSDYLLDEACSYSDVSIPETANCTEQDIQSSAVFIKDIISSLKVS